MLGKLVTRASGNRGFWESRSPECQEPGDAELLSRETGSFGDLVLMDRSVSREKLTKTKRKSSAKLEVLYSLCIENMHVSCEAGQAYGPALV